MESAARELRDDVGFHRWVQFIFFRQWLSVRETAHSLGISIVGDVPIYVAIDSADVWAHQELFHLDADGEPTVVAGVPPDYFSKDGQRWGNPIYRWDRMAERGYRWWIERLRANLELADVVRLDHFRGFAGYWEIPADEPTARNGRWVDGPGNALFDAVRDALDIPGMRVLQFAFGDDENIHLPESYDSRVVAYTGTHDNDTTRGWFETLDAAARNRVRALVGEGDVVEGLIRALYESDAAIAIVPLQDVLGLGSEARMNRPGLTEGNWSWRAGARLLDSDTAEGLAGLAKRTNRIRGVRS